ncbi:MAG: hypothetical protein ACE5JG_06960 [Planctomycetota bacterium]
MLLRRPAVGAVIWLAATGALLAGCRVRLVADYDRVLDRGVTNLHKKTAAFWIDMERKAGTEAGTYAPNTAFYDDARVAVESLRLRAAATPKNELTVRQLDLLAKNFELLAEIHRAQSEPDDAGRIPGLDADVVAAVRANMDVQFGAILRLEIAKKRTGSGSKG